MITKLLITLLLMIFIIVAIIMTILVFEKNKSKTAKIVWTTLLTASLIALIVLMATTSFLREILKNYRPIIL